MIVALIEISVGQGRRADWRRVDPVGKQGLTQSIDEVQFFRQRNLPGLLDPSPIRATPLIVIGRSVMRLVALTYGTEGDTRPIAALCHALKEAGHDVFLLADENTLGSAQAPGWRHSPTSPLPNIWIFR